MIKNTAGQKLVVFAYDTLNQSPMTGDAANITAKLSKDGGSYTATNDTNPTEIEKGRYAFDMTQAETNCDRWHLVPGSVTSGVVVVCEETCFTTEVRPANSDIAAIKAKTDTLTFTGSDVRATLDGETVSISNSGITESSFAKGAISAEVIATDAIGALELSAGAASEIAAAVRTELATELGRIDVAISSRVGEIGAVLRATQADDGTLVLFEGMTYDGTAHDKISFAVTKNYTAATAIVLSIYDGTDADVAIKTAAATATSSTLVEVTTLTATFPGLEYSGNPQVAELRYSLQASWSGKLETIATGRLFVYETPPIA